MDWKIFKIALHSPEVTMVTEQVPLVEFVGVRVLFQVIVVVGLKDCSHFAGRVSG